MGRRILRRGQVRALHPLDERLHVAVARVEGDHEVVVADLAGSAQLGPGAVPRVLVVQHHRPAHQRLELGDVLVGVEDLLGGEDRVVRVVRGHDEGQRVRLGQELGHRRLDRGQLGGVVQLGPEQAEQQVEDGVLGLGVPGRRERAEGLLDRGHLALAVLPRRQHGQVHVIPALGQVTPAGRAPVEHGDRVAVGPVEVLAQVAQQFEAPGVTAGLDPGQDVGPGRRLRLEVPPDHRGELVQRLQHREVQLAEEVGGEHQAAMPVDHERFHVVTSRTGALARVLPCPVVRRGPGA